MRQRGLLIRLRQRLRAEGGISMVEMIMAIFVFAVVMAALVPVFATSLKVSGTNRNRSVAANLASEEMDIVRTADFTTLPLGLVTSTQSVDGVTYTINRETEWISQAATAGPCQGGSGSALAFLRITVTVDWPNRGAIPLVQSQTVITPPVGAYTPNTGNIAVLVVDRNGAPASGHVVTLTGPQGGSQVTPSDGCAFFAYLPAGAYTVSLNTSGYVDQQGVANPSQAASVNVGTTTSIQFIYDRAASLDLTLTAQPPATGPDNAAVVIANTTLLPNGERAYPAGPNPRTISGLFPFTAGYSVWAGDCADSDPEGKNGGGTPYWPGATRATPLATTPGGTTSGSVYLSSVNIKVRQGGNPVPGAFVMAVHAPDAASCTSGNTLTYNSVSTNPGGVVDAAVPYGTWEIQVVGALPVGGSWPTIVCDPRVNGNQTVTVDIV